MAQKRAAFLTYGADPGAGEIRRWIEDAGVILDVRDIEKQPLTEGEIERMIGFLELNHFLNPMSKSYRLIEVNGNGRPDRRKIAKLIADDFTLLRRPIIRTNRLLTIGTDRRKIAEMLQISLNPRPDDDQRDNGGPRREPVVNRDR